MKYSNKLGLALTGIIFCSIALLLLCGLTLKQKIEFHIELEGRLLRQKTENKVIFASILELKDLDKIRANQTAKIFFQDEKITAKVTSLSNEFSIDDTRPMIYFENLQPLSLKEITQLNDENLKIKIKTEETQVKDLIRRILRKFSTS